MIFHCFLNHRTTFIAGLSALDREAKASMGVKRSIYPCSDPEGHSFTVLTNNLVHSTEEYSGGRDVTE
jgi:hypothetical protein